MRVSVLLAAVSLVGLSVSFVGILHQRAEASVPRAQVAALDSNGMKSTQGRGYTCDVENDDCNHPYTQCVPFTWAIYYTRSVTTNYNPGKHWRPTPYGSETAPTDTKWCSVMDYYYEANCNSYKDRDITYQSACPGTATKALPDAPHP